MSRFLRSDFSIKRLVENSFRAIDEGAYETTHLFSHEPLSLRKAVLSSPHAALITEIKFASPSEGKIRQESSALEIASAMVGAGAIAISVLTQPYLFNGSIDYLAAVRKAVNVPLLMKDIVVSRVQLDAAKKAGADCILLIKTLFDRNLAEESIESLAGYAAKKGLGVLIEIHTDSEFAELLKLKPDLIGINNRNLDNLQVDITITESLLSQHSKGRSLIISESGITKPDDIRYLRKAGADAFLVGTEIMKSSDIAARVKELCQAL